MLGEVPQDAEQVYFADVQFRTIYAYAEARKVIDARAECAGFNRCFVPLEVEESAKAFFGGEEARFGEVNAEDLITYFNQNVDVEGLIKKNYDQKPEAERVRYRCFRVGFETEVERDAFVVDLTGHKEVVSVQADGPVELFDASDQGPVCPESRRRSRRRAAPDRPQGRALFSP